MRLQACSLGKLQDAVGGAGPSEAVLSKLLAADFDPDDYDKLMAEAFNQDYYEVCSHLHTLLGHFATLISSRPLETRKC